MDPRARSSARRLELVFLAILLLLAAAAGVLVILEGAAFGWDESVYAIASRNLVAPHPAATVVMPFRPPGLPMLATVAAVAGFADPALRLVTLTLGLASLLAAWLLARLMFGPRVAIMSLAACIASALVLEELPLFHNDIASTGILLLLMALLWHQFQVRPAPGRMLLLAAPLAAGGFYLRFGILAALIGIALAATILWWRSLWARKLLVLGTIGLTVLLVLPHLVWATIETGRPWGIVVWAADQVNTSSPLESLVSYLAWVPTTIAGPVAAIFVVAGGMLVMVVAVRGVLGRPLAGLGRPVAWLAIPGLVAAAGTISVSHAEARYVMFSMVLATILGAEALGRAFDRVFGAVPGGRIRGVSPVLVGGVGLAAAVLLMVGVSVYHGVRGQPSGRWYKEPALAIAAASESPCVVATTLWPMVGWYSGCRPVSLGATTPQALLDEPAAAHWVLITSADAARASEERRDAFGAFLTEPPFAERVVGSAYGRAYRIDR